MKKKRYQERTFHKIVYHSPTYTVVNRVPDDLKPLTNFGYRPTFTKKDDLQSRDSSKRCSNAINWMLVFADKKRVYSKKEKKSFSFRLAFITLTLSAPQAHSDTFIKDHLLQPFLYWISRYYCSSYVWKAETQLNGNIHFHITVDTFIHWKSIRAKWNSILLNNGYPKVNQRTGKEVNSTDVHSVHNELECAKYIASYISKKNQYDKRKHSKIKPRKNSDRCNMFSHPTVTPLLPCDNLMYLRFIGGRLWGCSTNLSKIQITMEEYDDMEFYEEEHYFFRKNTGFQNLGKLLAERAEKTLKRSLNMEEAQKFRYLENVWLHRNLITMKKGNYLASKIHDQKLQRQRNTQKHFTVETLY